MTVTKKPDHECVFAVIDTASKTGTEHDATAVTFFAIDRHSSPYPLMILDWDIVQIEGALLETWLPLVYQRLDVLAQQCRARRGAIGALIEDKNSGTILLQQALRRNMLATAIDSKLTSLGKDERALSVSGYVYSGKVKYTNHAYNKVTEYKRRRTISWIRLKAFGWETRTTNGTTIFWIRFVMGLRFR